MRLCCIIAFPLGMAEVFIFSIYMSIIMDSNQTPEKDDRIPIGPFDV